MSRSSRSPWPRRLLLVAVLAFTAYEAGFAVRIWQLRDHNPRTTAFMQARRAAAPSAAIVHRWLPYRGISPALKRAVIAGEDTTFVEHGGFDWEGIATALDRDVRAGEIVAGGSTISQQLAKNLFLSAERSVTRKAQEAVLTVMLEAMLSKRRILEIYLNVIEWGRGVFGAEAAARHYFGVDAAALNPAEAARLAAMIPSPRYYDRHGATAALRARAATLRQRMSQVRIP